MSAPTLHATALLVGASGVLLRGPSGAGKSALADEVIARARAEGRFAALVADDRVMVSTVGGRLIARPPAPLAGLIERRGLGVMSTPHEPAAILRAVVDLVEAEPERVPHPNERVDFDGIALPRLALRRQDPSAARLILVFLTALAATA